MASSSNNRRVFAHNNNINFNDYTHCIKGQEIYKKITSKGPSFRDKDFYVVQNELTKFLDYDTFLNLTRTFYRYHGPGHGSGPSNLPPSSIHEAQDSFINYKQLLSHIQDCDYCCRCRNIDDISSWKEAKTYLYPSGNIG